MPLLFTKKSLNITYVQYTLLYILIVVLVQITKVNASENIETLHISSLGNFKAKFSEIKKVKLKKGQNLIGEIDHVPGKNYSVTFPFDIQRINYLVNNGDLVNQGDTVATVEGYDVHHFIDEFESSKALLEIQETHYQTNKKYFENRTIKTSQWIEITKSYYEAKLDFEHIQHQMSFLHIDENDQVSFVSPKSGFIQIPTLVGDKQSGELAFDIIARDAIKAKVNVPILLSSNLSHFEITPNCTLKITNIEKITDKLHQVIWAEPTTESCTLSLGQTIKVTPIEKINGFKIPKSAIFELENINYVAIKANNSLSIVPINLISSSEENYIFTTKENIDGMQVLISSVSILQGYLLNLGAE